MILRHYSIIKYCVIYITNVRQGVLCSLEIVYLRNWHDMQLACILQN